MIDDAAESLDVQPVVSVRRRSKSVAGSLWNGRVSLGAAAAVVLLSSLLGVGMTAIVYQRITAPVEAKTLALPAPPSSPVGASWALRGRALPSNAAFTIMFGAYPLASSGVPEQVRALTAWLENAGLPVYYAELDRGMSGRWYRVMAGSYTDYQSAARDLERLKAAPPSLDAHIAATSADGESP